MFGRTELYLMLISYSIHGTKDLNLLLIFKCPKTTKLHFEEAVNIILHPDNHPPGSQFWYKECGEEWLDM